MSKPQFTETAWADYLYWLTQDKKNSKKINALINDIMRNGPDAGTGHPEPLSGDLSGYYSRHINEKDRLVYKMLSDDVVEIYSCRGHYEK